MANQTLKKFYYELDAHEYGYSVSSVYGMCGSAWTHGGIKTIHAPVKLAA